MGSPFRSRLPVLLIGSLLFTIGCGAAGTENPGTPSAPKTTASVPEGGATLVGTGGRDVLRGGDGDDEVRGLGGDDEITGGEGRDRLSGGPGDDVVDAQDPGSKGEAGKDEISCGPGRDEVLMDAGDGERPEDCEMAGVGQS